MTRHQTLTRLARSLRPNPIDIAGAAALQSPSLLLQLQAAQPRRSPAPPRRHAGGPRAAKLRVFMLTLLVVDDLAALAVISFVYPGRIDPAAIIAAAALLGLLLSIRAIAGRQFRARGTSAAPLTPLSVLSGIALWVALFESGLDPVVSGLVIGLLTNAYEPRPAGPAAISPNERLLHRLHPWTSRLVVPIFALANAGLQLDGRVLAGAATSPITWGIVLAYVAGKPLGILLAPAIAALRRPEAVRRSRVPATSPC